MTAPRWATALLRRLAPPLEAEVLAGDLEEAHRPRVARRGALVASLLTALEAVDIAFMLVRRRVRLPRLGMSWLDLKLGARMLVRYPVLTLVGGAGLTFAIAIGAAVFAFISLLLWPSMPLPEGDRIVRVRLHDDATNQYEGRLLADYVRWRGARSTLTDFGAGRAFSRNVTMRDATIAVSGAEVTASTFDLVRVAPILGRALTDADALPAAPPVIVIGYALWRKGFSGDPGVVGQSLILGETPRTIVGVMPERFQFPVSQDAWVPLQIDEAGAAPRAGASFSVWARLAPGADLERATSDLAAIQGRAAVDWPATHAHLRAEVADFASSEHERDPAERMLLGSVNVGVGLMILLISANVALLMFARAATRESEIIVRTALGASRGRLIAQFFSEALLLSGVSLVLGLASARVCFQMGIEYEAADAAAFGRALPFWFYQPLPPLSIAYACGLALLSAVVTGVLPAIKVTRGLSSRLRESTAGAGGLKFGDVWTVVIVAQIAVTMTFPMFTFFGIGAHFDAQARDIGVPQAQVLSARLTRDPATSRERYTAAVQQVRDLLAAVPGANRVTLADRLPLMEQDHWEIEVDEGGAAPTEPQFIGRYRISSAAVDPEFFAAFDAPALAGRLFAMSDYVERPHAAIVNQSFVDRVLGGRNPIGRRVRYWNRTGQPPAAAPVQPWYEIVGLVRDVGMAFTPDPQVAGVYLPLDLPSRPSLCVGVRMAGAGDFAAVSAALGQLARQADVTLRVTEVQSLDRITANAVREVDFWLRLATALSVSALMLALSGIYAVMSFAVSRRTREIGIRVALGSNRARVVLAVLRKPLTQVVAGVIAGTILTFVLTSAFPFAWTLSWVAALAGYALIMFGVCLLACLVPARRALRVDPISALRTE